MLHFFTGQRGINLLQQDESLDFSAKKAMFVLCNEHAARFTVSNELEKAGLMLDKAQAILTQNSFAHEGNTTGAL